TKSTPGKVQPTTPVVPKGLLSKLAKQNQIPVRYFSKLADMDCLEFMRSCEPDVIINLSGVYVPRELLSLPKLGVLSGHYGFLPVLRGGDTIRWTIWLDLPMVVSHMFLAPELDMGDILRTSPIPVTRGDTIACIRKKCQMAVVEGHLEILDSIARGSLKRRVQRKAEGSVFFMMGRHLRKQVDKKLELGLYENYAGS
ncbi:MAG: hypothetical protein GTO24_01220, partial [candidate division Zixibacteria bacterium]|nr:hypothetical protein [candidate division Zixibacteria bacterium]